MKGIVLAGGKGTRLHPITLGVCKQLLPIYDKPMIYYPLTVLIQAGIRDILFISTATELPRFRELFGTGEDLGLSFSYAVQEEPNGIAEAFLIGEQFIGDQNVALVLGDNFFYGNEISPFLSARSSFQTGAQIFAYEVKNPQCYGVLVFDSQGNVVDIEEKPIVPKSRFAVTGLYFYDRRVVDIAKQLTPSARGELEITDVSRIYLKNKELQVHFLQKGFAWFDMGTPNSLHNASEYVKTMQERQGSRIACVEEVAHRMGYISLDAMKQRAENLGHGEYANYLRSLFC